METAGQVGLSKEWLADHRILCYRFAHSEREAVDACARDVVASLASWPKDQPLRLIIDIRSPRAIISAYAMHRARDLASGKWGVRGRVALLVGNRATATIAAMALRALTKGRDDRLIFIREEEAVAWLLEDDTMAAG